MIARHLTHPGRVASFDDEAEAGAFIRAQGGYIVSTRGDVMTWSDFPTKNIFAHPIELPPIPLHLLRDRMP